MSRVYAPLNGHALGEAASSDIHVQRPRAPASLLGMDSSTVKTIDGVFEGEENRLLEPGGGSGRRGWRIALYSPGMVGLGHARRNLLVAQALATLRPRPAVLIIAETRHAAAFAMSRGVDCLTLPALRKDADGRHAPRYLGLPLADLVELRAKVILSAARAFQPDALIVDHLPRGALGELVPTLRYLRAAGRTRCVLGLRDVLEDPATVRREWARAANKYCIRAHYDAVWVYGDRRVCDHAREYRLPADIAAKLRYTGYLDQRERMEADGADVGDPLASLGLPPGKLVLGMVGGGQDGGRLAQALATCVLPRDTNLVILTGPFMPADVRQRLERCAAERPNMRVLEFVPDPTRLLRRADRVIAMGGYNTVLELLSFEKPALVVPRVHPRTEQLIRAERLHALGLLDVLHPDHLSPEMLGQWLAGETRAAPRAREHIDLGGLQRLPRFLEEILAAPARADAVPLAVGHVGYRPA